MTTAPAPAADVTSLLMDRRRFLTALGGGLLAAPLAAEAQPEQKLFRLGAVSAGAPRSSPHWVAFAQRLHELGYVEGKSISIKFRNAEGKPERLPDLMAELVRSGVDVILPVGPEASLRAAKETAAAIPIVVVAIDYDPIARGYVGSLAKPGGNITGVFLRQPELTAKRIELRREVLPTIRRLAVFWDAFSSDQADEAEAAMKAAARQGAGALLGLASPIFFRQRAELAQAAIKNRLASIIPFQEAAEAGVLMAYGANLPHMLRRASGHPPPGLNHGRSQSAR